MALNDALPATADRAAHCIDSEKVTQRSKELHIIALETEKPFVVVRLGVLLGSAIM